MTTRPELGTLDDLRLPTTAPLVVVVDPGMSTGWAIWSTSPREPWLSHGQGPSWTVLTALESMLKRIGRQPRSETVMVVERFVVPPRRRGRSSEVEATLEVVGACRMMSLQLALKSFVTQLPGERQITSRQLMKDWGWDAPDRSPISGKDAISAVQHLGSYLLQRGSVPLLKSVV